MLVPAALADASSRPSDATIGRTTDDPDGEGATVTDVSVSYRVGGHSVTQDIFVSQTDDKTVPYLLHDPYLELVVTPPDGLTVTVNGIALDGDTSSGMPVFPGAYTATTDGNALLQSTSQGAVYEPGDDGNVAAVINFSPPPLAANAQAAVQQGVNDSLDSRCVNGDDSFADNCPITAHGYRLLHDRHVEDRHLPHDRGRGGELQRRRFPGSIHHHDGRHGAIHVRHGRRERRIAPDDRYGADQRDRHGERERFGSGHRVRPVNAEQIGPCVGPSA